MNQEKALQLWDELYGEVESAYDYASHLMHRSDFNNENSIVGWTVDYKKPLSQGGSMQDQNLIPCSYSTYRLREEKNAFCIGSHAFEVRKGKAYKTYELYDITDKSNPLCLDPYVMDQDPDYNRDRKKDISSYSKTEKNPTFSINEVYKKALKTAFDDIEYKEDEEEKAVPEIVSEENTMPISDAPVLNGMVAEDQENGEAIQTEEIISEEKGEEANQEVVVPSETETSDAFDSEPKTEETEFVPELKPMEEEESENEVILPESAMQPETEIFDSEKPEEEPIPSEEPESSDSEEITELKQIIQKKDEEIVALNDRLSELDDIIAQKERDGEIAPDYERIDATEEKAEEDLHHAEDQDRIHELEEELARTKDELQKLTEDKLSLESDKSSAEAKIASLNESLKENEDLKVHNAEKDGEIYGLRSQLKTLLQENENLRQENTTLQSDSASDSEKEDGLQKEKEELESRLHLLEEEKNAVSSEKLEKETEITSLQERMDSLEKELSSLHEENDRISEEKEKLTLQNTRIKEEKEQVLKETEALNQEFLTCKEEKTALQEQVTGLEEEKHQLVSSSQDTDTKVLTLTSENEELKKQIEALNAEKETLSSSVEEKAQKIQELEKEKENQNTELTELQESLNQVRTEKETEIASLNEVKGVLTTKVTELQNALAQEKENNDVSLSAKEEELSDLRQNKEETDKMVLSLQDQLQKLNEEKAVLIKSSEETNASAVLQDAKIADLENQLSSLKKEEEELLTEKQSAMLEKDNLAEEKKALEEELKEKNAEAEGLNKEYQNFVLSSNEQIEELNAEINSKEKENLILTSGGSPKYLKDILEAMREEKDFNLDSIHDVLNHHPAWKVKDDQEVSFVPEPVSSEEETYVPLEPEIVASSEEDLSYLRKKKEKEQKALSYFDEIFGIDSLTVSDFAGRFLRRDDYGNANSTYGWDYALLNENEPDMKTNVILMNLKTLKNYRSEGSFETNSHTYEVKEVSGVRKVVSTDYVTDPFDYQCAVRVTLENQKKTTPLIYLFVKGLSLTGNDPDPKELMTFFDLIDRTVRRCCPDSFMEMKTSIGTKSDYAFITFDGTAEGAYKEAMDYALVLNSYRQALKQNGKLNAVIVIGEINVPFSMRHFSFEKLYAETKSLELLALRYEFMATSVVDSMIKKTIHIAPSIIDKLPINQNATQESRLGKGNFSKAYDFKGEFRLYNYGYTLRSDSSENTNK